MWGLGCWDTESKLLDGRMLDSMVLNPGMLDTEVLGHECWILYCWIFDLVSCLMDLGYWILHIVS